MPNNSLCLSISTIILCIIFQLFCSGKAMECRQRNGTDPDVEEKAAYCPAGVEMCYKFQCNERVVKGCGGCNDTAVQQQIPNFECLKGWRFCGSCTDKQQCNGAAIGSIGGTLMSGKSVIVVIPMLLFALFASFAFAF